MLLFKYIVAASLVTFVACNQPSRPVASNVEGFSANSNGKNVAVMLQGSVGSAANDMVLIDNVLKDSVGAYNFDVKSIRNATYHAGLAEIEKGASQVSANGTLFVYLGGHGSPDGGAEMNDGYQIHYNELRAAIKKGAKQPFKRLVVVIFGCFSGSWLNNIKAAEGQQQLGGEFAKGLYEQLVIITSSSSQQYSYFGQYSNLITSFSNQYAELKKNSPKTATVGQFLIGTRAGVQSSTVQFAVYPESVKDELLFNSMLAPDPMDIKLLLLAANDNKEAGALVSAHKFAVQARICWGNVADCKAADVGASMMVKLDPLPTQSVAKRKIFQTPYITQIAANNDEATLLSYDETGKVIQAAPVFLKAK